MTLNVQTDRSLIRAEGRSARDALVSSINSSLGSTLGQLDAQEHDQRQAADDAGYTQQVLQEQIAHAGAASLQQSVTGAAATVQSTLSQLQTQLAGGAPPDPETLDQALSEVEQRLNAALGTLQGAVEGGTALAAEQIGGTPISSRHSTPSRRATTSSPDRSAMASWLR